MRKTLLFKDSIERFRFLYEKSSIENEKLFSKENLSSIDQHSFPLRPKTPQGFSRQTNFQDEFSQKKSSSDENKQKKTIFVNNST